MADNHVTVEINRTDVDQLLAVLRGDEESLDLPGHINGQPLKVRFRAEPPTCTECGSEYFVTDSGVTHHYSTEGMDNIDHDADADHVALPDPEDPR